MKSREYWNKRISALAKMQHKKADRYVDNELRIEYLRAKNSIQRDIEVFYQRFSENNNVSYIESKKLLNSNQLEEFKMQVDEFIRLAKNNPNGEWTKTLNNVSYKVRISRLQALQTQIEHQIQMLGIKEENQYTSLLSDTYKDTYYRTLYEIQKGTGIGVSFAPLEIKTVEKIIKTPWLEENYSSRIWGNKSKLIRELKTEITQAIIRGDSLDKASKAIRKRMDVSYRAASRLVQTEASHIQNEATYNSYKDSGVVKKYEYLATLDNRTSQTCISLDGKVFKLSDKQVGVNYPPAHPNCRSTVVPYFDDEIDVGKRIARNEEGKTYNVPGDMSYKKWYNEHVKPRQNVAASEKARKDIKNKKYKLEINKQKQNRHIEGTKAYKNRLNKYEKTGAKPSILNISIEEGQDIINKYHGTGRVIPGKGNQAPKEIIEIDKTIGKYFDIEKNKYYNTTRLNIHYSSTGTHIIPAKPKGDEK